MSSRSRLVILGLLGVVSSALLVGRLLESHDWNPTVTIKFGESLPEQNEYARDLLGPIVVGARAGHDGKFFFSQAMDPFYLEPDVHAIYLDRPSYRAQRMLYPAIAGLGGLLGPKETAWGLIVVNVLAMGTGTVITGMVAREMGLSEWFGLAFLFNPGLLLSQLIDGSEIVAMSALMAAILFAMRARPVMTAGALTLAALTRETMLLAVVGLSVYWIWRHRRLPSTFAMPFLAVGGWWAYVHWRLEGGLAQDTQALGTPLEGFIAAFQGWVSTPRSAPHLFMGLVLFFVSVIVVVRTTLRPQVLGLAVAGFGLLALIMSEPVWAKYYDSSRALAPLITAYVLMVPASQNRGKRTEDEDSVVRPIHDFQFQIGEVESDRTQYRLRHSPGLRSEEGTTR